MAVRLVFPDDYSTLNHFTSGEYSKGDIVNVCIEKHETPLVRTIFIVDKIVHCVWIRDDCTSSNTKAYLIVSTADKHLPREEDTDG